MSESIEVNGLPLPSLLVSLLRENRWQHPGDLYSLRPVIPFLQVTVEFLPTIERIRQVSAFFFLADWFTSSGLLHAVRGSTSGKPVELPWLDVERAVAIGEGESIGDDFLLVLDYRTDRHDPRVIANYWQREEPRCSWREVTATFAQFVRALRIE